MPFRCWIRSFCPQAPDILETVVSTLANSDVETSEKTNEIGLEPGIVILGDVAADVCEFVGTVCAGERGRVLAVVVKRADAPDGAAWQLLQAGASDVLIWEDLADPGAAIAARLQRWQEIDELVQSPDVRNHLVGDSQVWTSLLRRIVEAAVFTDAPILLTGETGTGKELAARLMHGLDRRRRQRELVVLDCTTIVPDLSGSELFGHERGAFTGAVTARDGAFALADGGTLFLDEVGELPLDLQVQLLRVLQEQTYKRVGSNTWHKSDFRLLCATNRDLYQEESSGKFRRDLFYRVASWIIKLPPLRDRTEDILPLVRHFMQKARPGQDPPELDRQVQTYFLTRNYPGNVRDLKNLVFRIMARHVGVGPVTVGDIPTNERPESEPTLNGWCDQLTEQRVRRALATGLGLRDIRRAIEEVAIKIAVEDKNGDLPRAAKQLGVTVRTIQQRRAQYRQKRDSMIGSGSSVVPAEDG